MGEQTSKQIFIFLVGEHKKRGANFQGGGDKVPLDETVLQR